MLNRILFDLIFEATQTLKSAVVRHYLADKKNLNF